MIKRTPINFDWKYKADFKEDYLKSGFDDKDFETVNIPHSNIEVPENYFDEKIYQFESCYRKELSLAKLDEDERVYIHFEGVMVYARIYLNGQFMGEHKGGYTGFRVDLTEAVIPDSQNDLAVYVDSREREDTPPFGHVVDYLTFGGIYREVSLEYCHKLHLEQALIKPVDILTDNRSVEADLYFRNDGSLSEDAEIEFILSYSNKEFHKYSQPLSFSGEKQQMHRLSFPIPEPDLWDIDTPVLYQMQIILYIQGEQKDSFQLRTGFRQIDFKKNGFYLNNRIIKLRGLNRHQSYPFSGYAMPRSAQYDDADILKKELGVITVRLSHYPQSRHFLDRCDELGILVFDEIPGWQHIGDQAWQELSLRDVRDMILTDGNHPSIFIWGVRINESQDNDDFYRKTNTLARELDSSRPTGGVRCFPDSNFLEDVFTYNDFSHTGDNKGLISPSKTYGKSAPYLVTEHNGHMFPSKKFDNEKHRLDQSKRHLAVLESMYENDRISGAIGWSMFDYYTHKDFGSGDKICYHGVMDMNRIPKLAASVYASQSDETPVLEVSSSMNIGENEGSLLGDIYIFTNCDFVRMEKNGNVIRDFYPRKDLYPYVPHPPVIIDDFIGDAIEKNESFSKRDAATIKEILTKVSREGYKLSLKDRLRVGWLMLRNHMNFGDAEELYTKYFGGWGDEATSYSFTGYLEGEPVRTVTKNQNKPLSMVVKPDRTRLKEEETWDTLRIVTRLEDEYGNTADYSHESFIIETKGPIHIIGPMTRSLVGGSTAFWVKTAGESGKAVITVRSERFGEIQQNLTIEKVIYRDSLQVLK